VALTKKLTTLDEIQQKKRVATSLLDLAEGKIFGGEFLLTTPLRFNAVVTSKTCDVLCVSYKDFSFEYKRCIKSLTDLFKYRNQYLISRVRKLKLLQRELGQGESEQKLNPKQNELVRSSSIVKQAKKNLTRIFIRQMS